MATDMTVARALVELKTLDKRIVKAIRECELIKVHKKDDKWDVNEFNRKASSQIQSALDLIARRDDLKTKVMQSNAVTKVQIGDRTYTVAEVIDRKQNLKYRTALLDHIRLQKVAALALNERLVEETRRKLDKLLETEFAKDIRSNVDNISSITKSYLESNRVNLLDPVNVASKIEALEDEILQFEKEADLLLAESNAVTRIAVEPTPLPRNDEASGVKAPPSGAGILAWV